MPLRIITPSFFALLLPLLFPASLAAQENVVDQGDMASEEVRDAHRVLQVSTAGSFAITGLLGTITAINMPTLFGDGRCAEGGEAPIFGAYGCQGLSTLHGIFGVLTTVLYAATVTTEFAAFDWPGQGDHGDGYEVLSGVHLGAMAIMPIAGLLSAYPSVIGISGNEAYDFQRVLRTVHLSVGYITAGAYGTTLAIDL